MAHSKFSASASERWLNCAASVALCEKAPPQKESAYAKEGTDAHTCLEVFLKAGEKKIKEATKFLNAKYPKDMVGFAKSAAEWIFAKKEELGATMLCETKVKLDFIDGEMFGTVDCALVDLYGTLYVIDFKYGAGVPVYPKENSQLIYYSLGIAHLYDYDFKDVCLVILQPRAETEEGPVREWTLSIEELRLWKHKFKAGVKRAKGVTAEFNADPKWCRWCPAKTICPEVSDNALAQARIDFAPQSDIEKGIINEPTLPDPKGIPDILLPDILTAIPKIETWMDSVKSEAFEKLSRGIEIKGFKLVAKKGVRKWTDPNAELHARKLFGDEAFTEPELKSPAQLEKIGPVAKLFTKNNAATVSSGETMVEESDPRPAIKKITIEEDFSESFAD